MATTTVTVTKDATVMSTGAASGYDQHHPIGYWPAGILTRALMYAPINFSGMTAINEARLYLRVFDTDFVKHAGQGSLTAGIRAHRKTADWPETADHGENSWGTGRGLTWSNVTSSIASDFDFMNCDVQVHGTWVSIVLTDIVREWFEGSPNYGVMVYNASSESNSAYVKEFGSRHLSGYAPYIWIDYDTNTAPNAPTSLSPTADAVRHTGSSVTLTGTRSDADSGDYITQYQTQVLSDGLGTTYHDAYTTPGGTPTTFSKVVSGLPTNVFLKWRARTRDRSSVWGAWSAYQRFKLNSTPNAPTVSLTQSPTTDVKTLTPTFNVSHSDPDATDTQAYKYEIELQTSAGVAVWDTGEVSVTPVTTVTKVYNGPALSWGTGYRWRARTQDSNGQWSAFTGWATFTTHETGVPTSLAPTAGTVIGSLVPTFSGARASSSDSLTSAQIQVYSSDGVTLVWDSGTFTGGVTASAFTKAYGGTTLAYGTTYKWRVLATSTIGGTSDWSALQTFVTPAADAVGTTAPVGSGITDLTPDFEFSRTDSFNAYQIVLYEDDGTTVVWDSGSVTHASATSKSITYPGTPALAYATTYLWKVRVSSDSGATWGSGYTDLVTFATDEAGVPVGSTPSANARLGAPWHMVPAETLTGITGNAYSTVSLDTVEFQQGASSIKAAIASHPAGTTDVVTMTAPVDLSDYGDQTLFKVQVKMSSLTNVTALVARISDSVGAYVEYDILPSSAGAWEDIEHVKGSPDASSGTIDWSDVAEVVFRLTSSATVTLDLWADDFRVDATNPSFDGSSSGGETIDTVQIIVYASDQTTVVWDSGDVTVTDTEFSVAYAGTTPLVAGETYYWTARYTESTGPTGGFSALSPFRLNAAPNAPVARTPVTGAVVADTLAPEFKATFSDPDLSLGDTPSLYEVEVYKNSDSTLMHTLRATSSLAAGENTLQRVAEGTVLAYETEYKWRARYADAFGEYGAWSSYNIVKPSESPTVAVTAPVLTISSPAFSVTWSFSSPGSKAQNRFRVWITRDSDDVLVYDSGTIFSSTASHSVPGGYLVNFTDYTIHVEAHDTDALVSNEATAAIASSWAAPDSIDGFAVTVVEDESTLLLTWNITNLTDEEFSYYQIYRREPDDADWTAYARITNKSTIEYEDLFAGNGVTYQYKITVWKVVVGDVDVESPDSEIPTAILDSDVWFVIGADRDDSHKFELPVYDETHNEPIQQEVFEPLGSRRKAIVRGKTLGAEGTLEVKWTDGERDAAKEHLRYLTDSAGPHILKSPFGDVWEVEFGGPSKKYSGGGHMAATLTWIEVV